MRVSMLVAVAASVLWIGCGSSSGGTGGTGGHAGTGGTGGTGGMLPDGSTDGAVASCNPAAQTGCTAPNTKCSVTFPDPQAPPVVQCTPPGLNAPGTPCTRKMDTDPMPDPSAPPGVDSCTNGYCTAFGASQGRQCARYCDVATEATNCASGQKCFSQADPYGLCRRICDPFGAMSQCPQANSMFPTQACSWQILVNQTASDAFCDVIGATVALGGACNPSAATPLDCQQGGVCLGDNVCHKLCDTTPQHACPAGQQCIGAQYLASDGATVLQAPGPNGGGWCITPMDAGTSILYTRPLVWQKNLKGGYK